MDFTSTIYPTRFLLILALQFLCMQLFQQIWFAACLGFSIWFFSKKVKEIRRNIFLGLDEDLTDNKPQRWKNMLLLAFGQKKMFKNPLVAILHLFIYVGFVVINIEVLEIVLDGLLGTHRLFLPFLGGFYTFLINVFELLALSVFIVCITFLVRRNVIKLKRFISKDLNGWPRTDANFILITEIVLMSLFLTRSFPASTAGTSGGARPPGCWPAWRCRPSIRCS